jgi:hypothetical protein
MKKMAKLIDKKKYLDETWRGEGSSGGELVGYFDFVKLMVNFKDLNEITHHVFETYAPCNLIGVELFGALFTAYLHGNKQFKTINFVNPLYILKKREHGAKKRFYGRIDDQYPIYIFDDVITNGNTLDDAILYLNEIQSIKDIQAILCLKNRSELGEIRKVKIIEL